MMIQTLRLIQEYQAVLLGLLGWNLFSFLLMGLDKLKSLRGSWRIREKTLILAAFAMGGLGCLLGSFAFRHKSRKLKFRILLPAAVLANVAVLILAAWYLA